MVVSVHIFALQEQRSFALISCCPSVRDDLDALARVSHVSAALPKSIAQGRCHHAHLHCFQPSPFFVTFPDRLFCHLFPHWHRLVAPYMGSRGGMQAITTSSIASSVFHHNTLILVPSSCSVPSSFALLRSSFLDSCRSLVVHTSISFEVR